jgi:hypothetical protein
VGRRRCCPGPCGPSRRQARCQSSASIHRATMCFRSVRR